MKLADMIEQARARVKFLEAVAALEKITDAIGNISADLPNDGEVWIDIGALRENLNDIAMAITTRTADLRELAANPSTPGDHACIAAELGRLADELTRITIERDGQARAVDFWRRRLDLTNKAIAEFPEACAAVQTAMLDESMRLPTEPLA